jgi:hypothetical protein
VAVLQDLIAHWPLDNRGRDPWTLTTPAVWDARTARYYTVAQASSPGDSAFAHYLLSWAATDPQEALDTVATRTALPRAVHSLWPLAPAAPDVPADSPAGDPDAPSTSGRAGRAPAPAGRGPGAVAGVIIVHTDGSVALNTQYVNGRSRHVRAGDGRVVGAAAGGGRVVVISVDGQRKYKAAIYAPKVRNKLSAVQGLGQG